MHSYRRFSDLLFALSYRAELEPNALEILDIEPINTCLLQAKMQDVEGPVILVEARKR